VHVIGAPNKAAALSVAGAIVYLSISSWPSTTAVQPLRKGKVAGSNPAVSTKSAPLAQRLSSPFVRDRSQVQTRAWSTNRAPAGCFGSCRRWTLPGRRPPIGRQRRRPGPANIRRHSSAGRALPWYGKGRGFDALWRLQLTSTAPVAQLAGGEPGQCQFESDPVHQCSCSPTGRGPALNSGKVQVRSLPGAPIFSLPSPSGPRHRSYKPTSPRFESWREYQCARSSVAEPRADNAETEVRFFTGTPLLQNWREKYAEPVQTGAACRRDRSCDRTRSVKPEWRGSGLLTRPQVARNHPGPPFPDQ
jgi:hypothetical protein